MRWSLNEHLAKIGRNVELCHPPKVLDKVKKIFNLLRSGERDQVPMWFKSERLGKFVYVTYAAVRDDQGDFQGVFRVCARYLAFL